MGKQTETTEERRTENQKESAQGKLFSTIPLWFAAIAGVIYLSGFLVVATHLGKFGLQDNLTEFWKPRYFHIGLLCSALPLLASGFAYAFSTIYIVRTRKAQATTPLVSGTPPATTTPDDVRRMIFYLVLFLNLLFMHFLVALFIRGHSEIPEERSIDSLKWAVIITCVTLFVIAVVQLAHQRHDAAAKKAKREKREPPEKTPLVRHHIAILWSTLAICVLLDIPFLISHLHLFHEMASHSWPIVSYLAFTVFLCCILIRVNTYVQDPEKMRSPGLAIYLCTCIPLYYLAIVSFAHGIFPYIPVTRGGGDYTVSCPAVFYIKGTSVPVGLEQYFEKDLPPKVGGTANGGSPTARTKKMIVIDETSENYIVADPGDEEGPRKWRQDWEARPSVVTLRRDDILHVNYLPPQSASRFKSGDIVRLKSGGPDMTVSEVEPDTTLGVKCSWFDGKQHCCDRFQHDALDRITTRPTTGGK
jgi:uncharacterized protein YodC (DUF2158 family)